MSVVGSIRNRWKRIVPGTWPATVTLDLLAVALEALWNGPIREHKQDLVQVYGLTVVDQEPTSRELSLDEALCHF